MSLTHQVYKATYPFQGSSDLNQLSFPSEAMIHVLHQQPEWWFGLYEGKKGWFPHNYVTPLISTPLSNTSSNVDTPMGGDTSKINAAARGFGEAPVFNPAYEDYVAETANRKHDDNPFRQEVPKAPKRKIFGRTRVDPLLFSGSQHASNDSGRPEIRIVSVSPKAEPQDTNQFASEQKRLLEQQAAKQRQEAQSISLASLKKQAWWRRKRN